MIGKWTRVGGLAFAVAALAVIPACSSSTASGPTVGSSPVVLHFFSKSTESGFYSADGTPITNPNQAPAVGDYSVSADNDYSGNHSSHSSTISGSDAATCTFTSINGQGGSAICDGVISLGNSMLLAQHVTVNFTSSNTTTFRITGGTGQYQGAHGTVVSTSLNNSDNSDFTVTVSK